MNRDQYLEYVEHFNNKIYDAVTSYFTPDVTVEYFTNLARSQTPARTLHGRQEFIDSYMLLHAYRDYPKEGSYVLPSYPKKAMVRK